LAQLSIQPEAEFGDGRDHRIHRPRGSAGSNIPTIAATAQYAIAEKVSLTASAGGEWRQYKSGIDDDLNPVWSLAAAYQPRDSTTIQLSFNQRFESSSRSGGQSYIYTGVTLRARQMLMQRLALNLSGTYSNSDYEATVQNVQTIRDDDLSSYAPALIFTFDPDGQPASSTIIRPGTRLFPIWIS
jgi:hypothetical protein